MSTGERYCSKCGTKGDQGASFCGKCGAFIGETPPAPPAPPVAPPPQPQTRTVERRYPRWDLRDLDMKSMTAHGWMVMGQSQEPGGFLRVTYATTAPPGQAILPAEVQTKPAKKSARALALTGGVVLLAVCLGIAVSANSGSGSASSGSGFLAVATATPPSMYAATYLDPRILASNATTYKGSNIYLQGEALTVEQHGDYTWVQLMAQPAGKSDTESVVVEMRPWATELLKGECYRIYGVAQGTQNVTRTLTGATNTVPLVYGYAYNSVSAGSYGIGCASPSTTR